MYWALRLDPELSVFYSPQPSEILLNIFFFILLFISAVTEFLLGTRNFSIDSRHLSPVALFCLRSFCATEINCSLLCALIRFCSWLGCIQHHHRRMELVACRTVSHMSVWDPGRGSCQHSPAPFTLYLNHRTGVKRRVVNESTGSSVRLLALHSGSTCQGTSYLVSLCFSFLICKTGIKTVPASWLLCLWSELIHENNLG